MLGSNYLRKFFKEADTILSEVSKDKDGCQERRESKLKNNEFSKNFDAEFDRINSKFKNTRQ